MKAWISKIVDYLKDWHTYLGLAFVLSICLLGGFVFRDRIVYAGETIWRFLKTVAFMYLSLFGFPDVINPGINDVNVDVDGFVATTAEELKTSFVQYFEVFGNTDNFFAYLQSLSLSIYALCMSTVLLGTLLVLFYAMYKMTSKEENNDYGVETFSLKAYKKIEKAVFVPIGFFFRDVSAYFKKNKKFYGRFLVAALLVFFNVFSIFLGAFSYVLYVLTTFDFSTFFLQIGKLFFDLRAVFEIPLVCWLVGIVLFMLYRRKKIGYNRLEHNEAKNCGFLKSLPICLLIDGSMGVGKTRSLTDMTMSLEVLWRDKALELMYKINMEFPHFDWPVFENYLKDRIKRGLIFNLFNIENHIKHLKAVFYKTKDKNPYSKFSKPKVNIESLDNAVSCFGYDYNLYGLTYDNGLVVVELFDALCDYAKLFYIFSINNSLIISNYSIRSDFDFKDCGNLPKHKRDFFRGPSVDLRDEGMKKVFSRIVDYDMLRLGKRMNENPSIRKSFGFGIYALAEIDKERGNMLDTQELKKLAPECNQKNDLFNSTIKMSRHPSIIRGVPFIAILGDLQRDQSINADFRELATLVDIVESGEEKLLLPYFWVEELVNELVVSQFKRLYLDRRYRKADNSLPMYLLTKAIARFSQYYEKIYNTFSCFEQTVVLSSKHAEHEHPYYIQRKKIYSARYSTNTHVDVFRVDAERADIGVDSMKSYKGLVATADELKEQNSFFVKDVLSE